MSNSQKLFNPKELITKTVDDLVEQILNEEVEAERKELLKNGVKAENVERILLDAKIKTREATIDRIRKIVKEKLKEKIRDENNNSNICNESSNNNERPKISTK